MSGFDLILELSPRAIAEMLRPQLTFNGFNFDPPSEITTRLPEGGELHIVLTDFGVSVGEDARITISFSFERGSLIGRPRRPDLSNLAGRIMINSRLTLDPVPMRPTQRALTLHLRRIVRSGRVLDSSQVIVRVPGSGEVAALLTAGIQQAVDTIPANPSVVLALQVDRTANGSINPPVFRDLRLGSVASEGRQSLVFFADLLPGPPGRGDVGAWQTTSLGLGEDASLLISPGLFHAMIFTPQVQSALRVADSSLLPRTCGWSESVPYPEWPEVSITRVADRMRDGSIEVELRAHLASPSGEIRDHLHVLGSITIEARPPNQILPRWRTEMATGNTEFAWGYYFTGFFLPFIHMIMAGRSSAVSYGAGAASSSLSLRLNPINLPALIPFTVRTAETSSDHLRLAGTVIRASRRSPRPTMQLSSSLTELSRELVETGTYESTGCPEGQYFWERLRHNQIFTCRPSATLASLPVRYRWQISTPGGGTPETLRSGAGILERRADCLLPGSIPARRESRTVRIEYENSGDGVLRLRNRPDDGVFHVFLICTATDAGGNTMEQQAHFDFAGDQVLLGSRVDGTGTWAADFQGCVQQAGSALSPLLAGALDQASLPHPILGHGPRPWELAAFVITASSSPDGKAAQTALDHAAMLYGPSMLTYMNVPPELMAKILPSRGVLEQEAVREEVQTHQVLKDLVQV